MNEKKTAAEKTPVDVVLYCPECGEQHIDEADPNSCETCGHDLKWHFESDNLPSGRTGCGFPHCLCEKFAAWLNPPHKSHRCEKCNHVWRPFDYPTNGVPKIKPVKVSAASPENQLDLFAIFELDRVMPKLSSSEFEPVTKRAAFADPENPLRVRAQEILASCGVRQTGAATYVVSRLTETGFEEYSVIVSKTGGPKCDCPDFVKKAPLSVGGKFRCEHVIAAHLFYREICDAVRN